MLYLMMFGLSAGCLYLAESRRVRNPHAERVLVCVALLLPALMAGLRSSDIGTDVTFYVIPFHLRALEAQGLADFLRVVREVRYFGSALYDQLFWILLYLCAQIVPDYHLGLFFYNLIVVVLLYLGLRRCHQMYGTDIVFGMLCSYLLLYNRSLNLMRMMIAVAIIFYAATLLPKKGYIRFAILSLIACFFHPSAVIAAAILVLYLICYRASGTSLRRDLMILIWMVGMLLLVLLAARPILSSLVEHNMIRKSYLHYVILEGTEDLPVFQAAFCMLKAVIRTIFKPKGLFALIFPAVSLIFYPSVRSRFRESYFYVICAACYLLMIILSGISTELMRFSYYFLPFTIVNQSMNLQYLMEKKGRSAGRKYAAVWIIFLLVYWAFVYVYQGACETIPYQFMWQEL